MAIQPISNGDQAGPSTSLYRPTHTLQAHSRAVTALRYSGDGRTLVSGGADGWVHFWYLPHAGRYWQTADSVGTVFRTNISEASKHIHKVSRSWRREFVSRSADLSGINDLTISPDSLYLVTASDSLVAHLHQLRPTPGTQNAASSSTPMPLQVYEGHTAPILSMAFSPTSNMLVSGSMDESAIIWDVKSGKSMKQLPAHSEAVWSVGWDAGGGICITSSADGLM